MRPSFLAIGIKAFRSAPLLHKAIWVIRQAYWRIERRLLASGKLVDISFLLIDAIENNKSLCVGKMGSVELRGVRAYLKRVKANRGVNNCSGYSSYVAETLYINAGVFPKTNEAFDQFASIYLDAVKQCDALAVWDVAGEARIIHAYCPDATLFEMNTLEPFLSKNPWTSALQGLRVLVISPFATTIRKQYIKRSELWDDPNVLPAFELLTIRAPLSAGIVAPVHQNWASALDSLKTEMDSLEYDVVLIGAGAFSLPLAVHAKNQGKLCVHMGGALQLLFGIIGKRWESRPEYAKFFNSGWTRPEGDEKPVAVAKIENACYW
ncbi:MAG: hypothetical protein P4L42_15265 [Desulfocapsaceae bacterium]|nr:hypothetical protein [Desulfocapsaceae bacterium]